MFNCLPVMQRCYNLLCVRTSTSVTGKLSICGNKCTYHQTALEHACLHIVYAAIHYMHETLKIYYMSTRYMQQQVYVYQTILETIMIASTLYVGW